MEPWNIIGWMILAAIFLPIAFAVVAAIVRWCRVTTKHLQTRNIQPAKGQVWVQEGDHLFIEHIHDSGNIWIKCGAISWADSRDDWNRRVRQRRLYLKEGA